MRVNAADEYSPTHRVILDGVDISCICYEADDTEGWAKCYIPNRQGHFIGDGLTSMPIEKTVWGQVVIETIPIWQTQVQTQVQTLLVENLNFLQARGLILEEAE